MSDVDQESITAGAPAPEVLARDIRYDQVAIVVLNWNRKQDTLECLASLEKADLRGARVIVVDNASRDDSVAAFRTAFPQVDVIALPKNRGYSGGNNAGMQAALDGGAQAIYVLNNDTVVSPDFLYALLLTANRDARVGAVSSVALRMDQPELLDAAYLDIYFGHGIVWHYGVNALPGEGFDKPVEIQAGIGCAMLFLTDALREIGLLDEAYFAYHEEVDWCFRARAKGWKIVYQPWSRIWHHGSRSTDSRRPPRPMLIEDEEQLPNPVPLSWSPVRAYLGARNSVRFVRQHATLKQALFFVYSTLYAVPLEYLAAVMGREEEYEIGKWTYLRVLQFYFLHRHGLFRRPPSGFADRLRQILWAALYIPIDLLWSLPRHVWRAHHVGYAAQATAVIRGLWDGVLNRPLPMKRLGLE